MNDQWLRDVQQVHEKFRAPTRLATVSNLISALDKATGSKNEGETWEALFTELGGQDRNPSTDYKTKQRTIDALARSAIIIGDEPSTNDVRHQSELRAFNLLRLALLLRRSGFRESAKLTLERAVKVCRSYRLNYPLVRVAKELAMMAAVVNDKRSRHRYTTLASKARGDLELDEQSRVYVDEAMLLLHDYNDKPSASKRKLQTIVDEVRELAKTTDSYDVQISMHRIALLKHGVCAEASELLKSAKQARAFLKKTPKAASFVLQSEANSAVLSASLLIPDFNAADEIWPDIQKQVVEGTSTWDVSYQQRFKILMKGKRFEDARDVLTQYERSKSKSNVAWLEQMWSLYRAYIILLIKHSYIDNDRGRYPKQIYVKNLEKACPDVLKDKTLGKVHIYILRAFQWLASVDYREFVSKADSYREFVSRHLGNPQVQRTALFMRKLSMLPSVDFDSVAAQRKGIALDKKHLKASSAAFDAAEVIPYETLWRLVIQLLREKKRR